LVGGSPRNADRKLWQSQNRPRKVFHHLRIHFHRVSVRRLLSPRLWGSKKQLKGIRWTHSEVASAVQLTFVRSGAHGRIGGMTEAVARKSLSHPQRLTRTWWSANSSMKVAVSRPLTHPAHREPLPGRFKKWELIEGECDASELTKYSKKLHAHFLHLRAS
jgi:hypothetical protein